MDLAALDSERFFFAIAADDEVDAGIDRTADVLGHIFQLIVCDRRPINGYQDIAALEARFFSRTAFHDAGDEDAVIGRCDVDADTGIGAAHLGRKIFIQVAAEIGRMFIPQRADHALQGPVKDGVFIDIFGVMAFDDLQRPEKLEHRRRPAGIIPKEANHGDNHDNHTAADISQRPADVLPRLP